MHTADPLVSIVVPTYREVGNIPRLVPEVSHALCSAGISFETILVDDNSRDGSEEAVAGLREQGYPVRMEIRTSERGLSSAVVRGFEQARGTYLVCMDADLSHPPSKIPEFIQLLESGEADFVLGSRYVPGGSTDAEWGVFRWINSKTATLLARPLVTVRDPMSGFFALPRLLFERTAGLSPVGYKIALELLVKTGARRAVEVPIRFADRTVGESKLNLREQWSYLRHLKRLFDHRFGHGVPLRATIGRGHDEGACRPDLL